MFNGIFGTVVVVPVAWDDYPPLGHAMMDKYLNRPAEKYHARFVKEGRATPIRGESDTIEGAIQALQEALLFAFVDGLVQRILKERAFARAPELRARGNAA
jgi:hypothetical protein